MTEDEATETVAYETEPQAVEADAEPEPEPETPTRVEEELVEAAVPVSAAASAPDDDRPEPDTEVTETLEPAALAAGTTAERRIVESDGTPAATEGTVAETPNADSFAWPSVERGERRRPRKRALVIAGAVAVVAVAAAGMAAVLTGGSDASGYELTAPPDVEPVAGGVGATLPFAEQPPADAVQATDADLSDGEATVDVKGATLSEDATVEQTAAGLTVAAQQEPGLVRIVLRGDPGVFGKMVVRPPDASEGGDQGVLLAAEKRPTVRGVPKGVASEATSSRGLSVSYRAPRATGLFGSRVPVRCRPASGSTFRLGRTMVTCTAVNAAGATTERFAVTVRPGMAKPVVTVPASSSESTTSSSGTEVTYAASARDENGTVPVRCRPPSGSVFPVGTTTVRCTARNVAGATARTFRVTVTQTDSGGSGGGGGDTTPPDITVGTDDDIEVGTK